MKDQPAKDLIQKDKTNKPNTMCELLFWFKAYYICHGYKYDF